jgi:hypothetical protein
MMDVKAIANLRPSRQWLRLSEESNRLENKRLCECNCGREVKGWNYKSKQPIRFIVGHQSTKPDGRKLILSGYIAVKCSNHHFANKQGYVLEHRLVYEQYHKCSLLPWADIHHVNGKKDDNRIENLQPYTHGQHISLEKKGKPNPSSKLHGFAKGCTPWNKGKKGLQIAWNKKRGW